MAFNNANFAYHTYTGGLPISNEVGVVWKYTTTDNISAIGVNYFNGEGYRVRKNDWITVQAADKDALFIIQSADMNPLSAYEVSVIKFIEGDNLSGYFTF